MFVGVLRLRLEIVGARSLKDKRSVVKSMKERAQARFKVSVAEVGQLDDPRRATIGVAVRENETSAEELWRHADAAMYQAKARGKAG